MVEEDAVSRWLVVMRVIGRLDGLIEIHNSTGHCTGNFFLLLARKIGRPECRSWTPRRYGGERDCWRTKLAVPGRGSFGAAWRSSSAGRRRGCQEG